MQKFSPLTSMKDFYVPNEALVLHCAQHSAFFWSFLPLWIHSGSGSKSGLNRNSGSPPPTSTRGKTGRNQLNEEITPLLPTGIGQRFIQNISNLGHAALLRRYELPYKRKCWTNSGGPLVNSVLWGSNGTIKYCSLLLRCPMDIEEYFCCDYSDRKLIVILKVFRRILFPHERKYLNHAVSDSKFFDPRQGSHTWRERSLVLWSWR